MHKSTYARAHTNTDTHMHAHSSTRRAKAPDEGAATDKTRSILTLIGWSINFRTFALYTWHIFFFASIRSTPTAKKNCSSSNNNCSCSWRRLLHFTCATTTKHNARERREREHKRAQLTRRGDRLCYVFYCCFLSFFAVVIAPRPSLCTRQELNAIWAHGDGEYAQQGEP